MGNFKKISVKTEKLIIDHPGTEYALEWVNIIDAGSKEVDYLRKKYKFNLGHLKASVANVFSQRPIVVEEDGYLFLILHFPTLIDGRVIAGEVEFFIGHGYLVSLHNGNLPALTDFFEKAKKDQDTLLSFQTESSATLLYEILDRLLKSCYDLMDQNSLSIEEVEDLIFEQHQKDAVSKILNLRRNIINVRKIMQNHKNILQKLMLIKSSLVPPALLKKQYGNLVEHSKRIWEMLENQKEMVNVLNDTNESLLNNRLSNIMKTLTLFSVIVFPLTLLAGIFGMNAKYMPFVNNRYGFWAILFIMILSSWGMLSYFKKKDWLN
ncbi:MAG: magnesium transporter CorA family protein [Patescibacteria group bacterium]|nr:magnesium transporter CorA family protein [Patescibacteria group bacterium]